jgi:predicted nucleic acid-binding protein
LIHEAALLAERQRALSPSAHRGVVRNLDQDWGRYLRIEAGEALIHEAASLAERHRLRGYDAIHLASAILVKNRLAEPVVFSSEDTALEAAARRAGLGLLSIRARGR